MGGHSKSFSILIVANRPCRAGRAAVTRGDKFSLEENEQKPERRLQATEAIAGPKP
jgi:hypothetical protein